MSSVCSGLSQNLICQALSRLIEWFLNVAALSLVIFASLIDLTSLVFEVRFIDALAVFHKVKFLCVAVDVKQLWGLYCMHNSIASLFYNSIILE